MKIAIIDEGIDQTHPFFSPAGYTMPAGYPKGQTAYTNAKVIVARAFPPASPTWKHASKPFDPEFSSHGTHVAGIAAGNANTLAEGVRISGVAPRAYLGNYKALTIPTDADVGLDGNSPELVAAIEAAVADGMDVINMSLGEPEIEPSRDIVVKALGAAARAGVVPVVSAGNDFDEFGRGSIGPAAAPEAITVGAVSTSRGGPEGVVASFSGGPTPLSLQLKPELSAPGVGILSAAPRSAYTSLSGTSMAAPHIAGAVALLLQRHPTWTPAQVKSALTLTGDPAYSNDLKSEEALGAARGRRHRRPATRRRRARVREPGLVRVRPRAGEHDADALGRAHGLGPRRQRAVDRDGRGADPRRRGRAHRAPGRVGPRPARPDGADDAAGRRRGDRVRRAHARGGAAAPAVLARHRDAGAGEREARSTAPARHLQVDDARRRDAGRALPLSREPGRLRLRGDAARPGARVSRHAGASRAELRRRGHEPRSRCPRRAEDRPGGRRAPPDRLRALPFSLNPYLRTFGELVLAAGTILPAAGSYDVVFDSPSASRAGVFSFRYWVNDASPPRASLRTRSVKGGAPLRIAASDAGSGVDPASVVVRIDDDEHEGRFAASEVRISTSGLRKGRHTLRLQISDYQESRNMENVARILPNTRILETSFVVR